MESPEIGKKEMARRMILRFLSYFTEKHRRGIILILHNDIRGDHCPHHRVTFPNYMDLFCFQFNKLLLVWTFLKSARDLDSTPKREQTLLIKERRKGIY